MKPVLMLADANVFLRFLRNDHPKHSPAAKEVIEQAAAGEVILRVPEIVVADIFYTLTAPMMKIPRATAARQLAALLQQPGIDVENRKQVLDTLGHCEAKNIDYGDAALIVFGPKHGAAASHSFLRPGFRQGAGNQRVFALGLAAKRPQTFEIAGVAGWTPKGRTMNFEFSPSLPSGALTPTQRRAVAARGNVLVMAGAGTGKTKTLVERCLDCLARDGAAVDEMLIVTFTEAAAAEMRERLRRAMEEKSRARTGQAPALDPLLGRATRPL